MDDNNVVNILNQNNAVRSVVNDPDVPAILDDNIENSQNATQSSENDNKKHSPLGALASKLAQLKSELVQEEIEDNQMEEQPVIETQDNNVDQEINDIQADINNQLKSVIEDHELVQTPQASVDVNSLQDSLEPVAATDDSQLSELYKQTLQPTENTQVETIDTPVVSIDMDNQNVDNTDNKQELITQTLNTPINSIIDQVSPRLDDTTSSFDALNTTIDQETNTDTVSEIPQKVFNQYQESLVVQEETEKGSLSVDDILAQYEGSIEQFQDSLPIDTKEGDMVQTNQDYGLDIRKILDIAIEREASDILISVGYPVMMRIDGALIAVHEKIVGPKDAEELINPVLSEQKKELLEVNREVDLAYTHQHNGEARFRINTFYSRENLAAAFRLIPTRIRTIEELNLPPIYNQFAGLKQGLVLVTGPTGHGKSTTLAAILQSINLNRSVHILTIEDPIEYIFPKAKAVIDQREMHDDTHSWTVALKSAMRQNPDVILVGEMRDFETISAAITLAETGHLVFATVHTNSAAQTIDRIIDVFPENQQAQIRTQLSSILEAVIAQRLIPIEGGGRRAVSEILIGTPAIKNLIREGKAHQMDNVIRTSSDVGMVSLESSLVRLVREGLITMDKAQEYAVHPEEVVRLLRG